LNGFVQGISHTVGDIPLIRAGVDPVYESFGEALDEGFAAIGQIVSRHVVIHDVRAHPDVLNV
jgi:hypothetical protein